MKTTTFTILAAAGITISSMISACSTTAQRAAYNTIASIESTASAALDGYDQLVIHGIVPTNGVPQVTRTFNQIQASCTLAATLDQNGTNAFAPANLTTDLQDLLNTINQFTSVTNH